MKLHHVLFVFALLIGIIAVVCTYYFGILPRHEHYQSLIEQEEQLRARIDELEKKFSGTQPAVVVSTWQEQVQPWAQSVSARLSYFDTLEAEDEFVVKVPEESRDLPKFWYQDERKRRMEALAAELYNANVVLTASMSQHEPPAPQGEGWNPDAASIEEWLETYERAASFVREMIVAKAQEIVDLQIWPSQVIMPAPEGTIYLERVGYVIIIPMQNFAQYLGSIHKSDSYISIAALKITKAGALSDADAPIRAEFILDRTRFVPTKTDTGEEGTDAVIRRRAAGGGGIAAAEVFGNAQGYSEEELARIRDVTAVENPGFFRGILRWFGI